jgi:hypothetical protein
VRSSGSVATNESNGTLVTADTQTGIQSYANVAGHFPLAGDFDISIDWKMPVAPASGDWGSIFQINAVDQNTVPDNRLVGNAIQIKRSYINGVGHTYYTGHFNGTFWDAWGGPVTTGDTSGRFRIKRVGSTVTVWYWNNGLNRWEWNGNTAGYTWANAWTTPCYVQIGVPNNVPNRPQVEADWNNFKVGAGTAYLGIGTIRLKQDVGQLSGWQTLAWGSSLPNGTSIKFRTRTAATEAGLASSPWSDYVTASGSPITSPPGRWIEVEATLATTDTNITPLLHDLTVTYGNNPGDILWQTDIPAQGATTDLNSAIGTLGVPGKYYLQGTLTSGTGQTVAFNEYPFYVEQGNTQLLLSTDKKIYRPGETVTISGEVKNLSSLNAAGLVLKVQGAGTGGATPYSETFNVPATSSHPFSFTTIAGSDATYGLNGAVTQNSATLAAIADQYVTASPAIAAAITAPDSAGNAPFAIGLSLSNTGKVDATTGVRITDDSGNVIDSQQVAITAGETRILQYTRQITGTETYTATFTGDLNQAITKTVAYAAPPPAATTVNFSAHVVPDKISYNANEQVAITSTITNQSTNVMLENLTAWITVINSQGQALYSHSTAVPQLIQGQTVTPKDYWNTAASPAGAYTVNLQVLNGTTVLSTSTGTFNVQGSSQTPAGFGASLKGIISATRNSIDYGKDEILTYSVTNIGNEALNGLVLNVIVANPDTQQTVQTYNKVITLPQHGSVSDMVTVPTSSLSLRAYIAVLQVTSANVTQPQTISSATFIVKDSIPPVTTIAVGTPKYETSGKVFITAGTVFTLTATDDASGVAKTEYRVDGGIWTGYVPFSIATERSHLVEYRSTDRAGNVEIAKSIAVTVDNTPPATAIKAGTPQFTGPDGTLYASSAASFTLSATDNLSGVARTEYRLDGGAWTPYATFAIPSEGKHVIGYRSNDNVGNLETEKTLTVTIDNTPPVSLATACSPNYAANGNLYVSGSTAITLSATDNASGVRISEYSIDGAPFVTYTAPINLASHPEGNHTIAYRSTDNLGNVETAKKLTVVLDKTPPKTAIAGSDPLTDGAVNTVSPVTSFTLTATDSLSGVKNIWYRIDGGQWQLFTAGFTLNGLKAGPHVISFNAVDNVGNEEAEQAITVRLIVFEAKKEISLDPVVLVGPRKGDDRDEKGGKKAKVDPLVTMLDSLGISYYTARDEDDFERALRSGRYNTYLLTGAGPAGEEMREGINYGDGLIIIKTRPDNDDDERNGILGVRFTGESTQGDLPLTLPESPFGPAATLRTAGKTVVARVTSPTAAVYGTVADKRGQYPAIVYNEYGRGKVLLFTFDLVNLPNKTKAGELLANSLSLVKPKERYLRAQDCVPVRIDIANSTEPFGLEVDETMPATTTADTITPVGTMAANVITWQLQLGVSEAAKFGYYLNLPDARGEYATTTGTKYANDGSYRPYDMHVLSLKVEANSVDLLQTGISDLLALPAVDKKDRKMIAEALSELHQIRQTVVKAKDAEENIERIAEATEKVAGLTIDAKAIRVELR